MHSRGFTLLELLVVVGLIGLFALLAAPSLRDAIVRNKMSGLGNEFMSSLQRARNEAVSKNTCVTMCMSTTTDATGSGESGPVCATTGADWQVGWMAFLDPTCSNTSYPTNPEDLLFIRSGNADSYHLLVNGAAAVRSIEFNSHGIVGLSNARRFSVLLNDGNNRETKLFGFNICLNPMGQTRMVPAGTNCA